MVSKLSTTLSTLKLGLLRYSLYWTLVKSSQAQTAMTDSYAEWHVSEPFCLLHFLINNLKGQPLPLRVI